MERRVLLAALLSIIAVTAFQFLDGEMQPAAPEAPEQEQNGAAGTPTPGSAEPAAAKPGEPAPPPAPAPGAPAPGAPGAPGQPLPAAPAAPAPSDLRLPKDAKKADLKSEELHVGFTSRGGAVEYVQVVGAHDSGRSQPLVRVAPANPLLPLGVVDDAAVAPAEGEAPGGAWRRDPAPGALRALDWTRDAADEAATPEDDVVYTLATPDGRTWRKQWFLTRGAGMYDIRLRLSVRGKEGAEAAPVPVKLLASANLLADEPSGTALGLATEAVYALASEGELSGGTHTFGFERRDVKAAGLGADSPLLVGVRSQYFLVCAYAAPGLPALPADRLWATGEESHARDAMGENLKEWFAENTGRLAADNADQGLHRRLLQARDHMLYAWVGLTVNAGAAPVEVAFYAGPISRAVLRTEAYRPMAPVITYPGAPDWLAEVLLWIYDRWRLLFGSAGLAVILLTLTVRGLLMPISIKNQLGMRRYGRKVQKLKPKVEVLKKKWAGNPQRLRQEQMLLYREHKIGVPMGCLMMLLQIPIFFALFGSVRVEYTLRGASFLWIRDLALPDRLVDLPHNFPLISSINLLPILLIGISIFQTRSMPKPTDEQQAQQMKMMKWMPILFAVILYSYTAALALYMVVSSTVALIESKVVKRKDEAEQAASEA